MGERNTGEDIKLFTPEFFKIGQFGPVKPAKSPP
jgi:hypothetical protein